MTSRCHWTAFALLALAGCSKTPRAPDLTTEAVYQNDIAGVRFLTPEGWTVYAKSIEPETLRDRPLRLIAYQHVEESKRADLEFYLLPNPPDLLKYMEKYPIGPESWSQKGATESTTIGGVPAKRYQQEGKNSRKKQRRELVEVPRGDRTYLFVLTTEVGDERHVRQARHVIESAIWK